MTPEHDAQIFTEFPVFFRPQPLNRQLAVGDGWFELIYKLCEEIRDLHPHPEFCVLQVKEKFGGLRFYVTHSTADISAAIHGAEQKSCKICEDCGTTEGVTTSPRPGKSWIRSLCPACREPKTETGAI